MQARRRRDLNTVQLSASLRDPFAVYGFGEFIGTLQNFVLFAKRRTARACVAMARRSAI